MPVTPTAFDSTGAKAYSKPERVGPIYADGIGDTTRLNAGSTNPNVMQYLDSRRALKGPVRLATAAALAANTYANGTSGIGATITANANGTLIVDGAAAAVNDRILVKDETSTNAPHNGIYTVTATGSGAAAFVLTRATDCDSNVEIVVGTRTIVYAGTANAGKDFYLSTTAAITVGTTNLTFTQPAAAAATPTAPTTVTSLAANHTLVAGEVCFVNITVAPVGNLVLPTTPADGTYCYVKDIGSNFNVFPVTVVGGGSDKVENDSAGMVLGRAKDAATLIYGASSASWWLI